MTKNDTISRQAAIDAVEYITSSMSVCVNSDECHGMKRMQRQAVIELANLPSAQPEVIRCKDCRWWDKFGNYDNGYCLAVKHSYLSEHLEIRIRRICKGDFYCADAEPKGEQE